MSPIVLLHGADRLQACASKRRHAGAAAGLTLSGLNLSLYRDKLWLRPSDIGVRSCPPAISLHTHSAGSDAIPLYGLAHVSPHSLAMAIDIPSVLACLVSAEAMHEKAVPDEASNLVAHTSCELLHAVAASHCRIRDAGIPSCRLISTWLRSRSKHLAHLAM